MPGGKDGDWLKGREAKESETVGKDVLNRREKGLLMLRKGADGKGLSAGEERKTNRKGEGG